MIENRCTNANGVDSENIQHTPDIKSFRVKGSLCFCRAHRQRASYTDGVHHWCLSGPSSGLLYRSKWVKTGNQSGHPWSASALQSLPPIYRSCAVHLCDLSQMTQSAQKRKHELGLEDLVCNLITQLFGYFVQEKQVLSCESKRKSGQKLRLPGTLLD